ncbi:hypothetical protein HYQ46_011399 [Verticillium longisporum]|nr:hypothetical protein HYQ46_011399 [Verticillium longisporum]
MAPRSAEMHVLAGDPQIRQPTPERYPQSGYLFSNDGTSKPGSQPQDESRESQCSHFIYRCVHVCQPRSPIRRYTNILTDAIIPRTPILFALPQNVPGHSPGALRHPGNRWFPDLAQRQHKARGSESRITPSPAARSEEQQIVLLPPEAQKNRLGARLHGLRPADQNHLLSTSTAARPQFVLEEGSVHAAPETRP